MRVGVTLPQYGVDFARGRVDAAAALDYALSAEAAGLDSVWVSDHAFAVAPDGSVSGVFGANALAAAAAARTDRIEVGTLVLSAAIRTPAQTAASVSSLTSVGGSRITCGIGAGWNPVTHRVLGIDLGDYPSRVSRLDASVALLRRLDPELRILVGGWGDPILDVAARHGGVWNLSWDVPAEAFRALCTRLDAACEMAGRDPWEVHRSVGLAILPGRTRRSLEDAVARVATRAPFLAGLRLADVEDRILVGTPEECAERIAAYGADEVVLAPFVRDDPDMLAVVGNELAPLLH